MHIVVFFLSVCLPLKYHNHNNNNITFPSPSHISASQSLVEALNLQGNNTGGTGTTSGWSSQTNICGSRRAKQLAANQENKNLAFTNRSRFPNVVRSFHSIPPCIQEATTTTAQGGLVR